MVVVSSYSKQWPCLLPQHGSGPKHRRPINLERWQQDIIGEHPHQLLRGLIHSDGCRTLNRVRAGGRAYDYGRYQFSNRSEDIHRIFTDALDRLEVPWRRMNGHTVSVARREAVAALDAFIEPKR